MAVLNLPAEILDNIVGQFSSDDQRTLASLAATCRTLYFHVVPALYRVYRIALAGAASFEHRTEVVRRLLSTATRVAGSGLPLDCIREVVVCGRWYHLVKPDVPYAGPRVARAREYAPFVDALSELLARVARLQSFRWLIDLQLPDAVAAAAAGHTSLDSLSLALETPLRSAATCSRASSPNVSLPLPFADNRLVALRALQVPTLASAMHCSHVLWTESNRQTIRTLELGVSQALLDDWFHRCADVVTALFTPPPTSGLGADWSKGQLPRLKLHRLKLCDVAFLRTAVDAVVRSVDAGELRDLQLLYCSNPSALFRRWEDNALPNLERLFVLEQHESGYSAKLLRQFGPDGTCRNLKALEATCWMSQWAGGDGASADDDGAASNSEERFVQFCSRRFVLHDREAPWEPGVHSPSPPPPLPGQTRLEPFATIRELCGNREEGWGLERLVLGNSWFAGHLPDQHNFLEPFWRLRELACHVSYTKHWTGFVDGLARLPSLEYVLLLNSRVSGGPFLRRVLHADALAIAAANRLRRHTGGGKLRYVGILPGGARMATPMVWRVVGEDGDTCRLEEVVAVAEKRRLGDGIFVAMAHMRTL